MQSDAISLVHARTIKRWSSIISSLVLLIALSGCGEATPTSVSAPATPISSPLQPTATPTATPEPEPMIVTLGLWLPEELNPYGGGPGADALAEQLTEFNEAHPDLQVEVTVKKASGRGGLFDSLRTARDAAPSVLPDLVVLDATDLETVAGSNLLQPLDDLLPETTMDDRFPFAREMGTVESEEAEEEEKQSATLGYVIGVDMQHLVYRSALFDSPPISWTQVISPAVPFLFAADGRDREVNDATLIQYLAGGGKLTDAEGQPWLDQEVMVSVLSFYSDCIDSGTISPTVVLNIESPDQAWERFQAGEGEMAVVRARSYWPWSQTEDEETIAAGSVPTQDGHAYSIARGWAIGMVAEDPARQALAMMLLNWLIAPNHNAEWTQAAGYLPGRRSALQMWNVSSAKQAMLRGMLDAATPAPDPETMNTAGRVMQEAVEAVLRRRGTPEEAAAAAAESLGQQ